MMLVALVMVTSFTGCKDDDDPDPGPDPKEEVNPYHFDLTVTVGKQGGMGRDVTTIMQSLESLAEGQVVDFKNRGSEINADYSMEAIVRGKYYYQVPVSADRFSKLQFVGNRMQVVQSQPFVKNTYNTRQYGSMTKHSSSWPPMATRTGLSGRNSIPTT